MGNGKRRKNPKRENGDVLIVGKGEVKAIKDRVESFRQKENSHKNPGGRETTVRRGGEGEI